MIPFIIGGVALAVTGYGIAKLFEDDVPCLKDDFSQSDLSEVIDKSENVKSKFCEKTLKELETAFKERKNIEISIRKPIENQYDFLISNDDLQDVIDKYITILEDTQNFMDTQLDKLQMVLNQYRRINN